MEATDPELNKSASGSTEWTGHEGSEAHPAADTCSSAPATTLQFESQSVATSLGYITHPTPTRPATPGEAGIQGLSPQTDPKPESFEFDRQHTGDSHEQHVPLTAPIDRSFDLTQSRFQTSQQTQDEASNGSDQQSPYLPPFRAAYSMPERPYSDSGAYARSPSPVVQQQQQAVRQIQSMPEAYGHPSFMPSSYHYAPQQPHNAGGSNGGGASVGPQGHPDMSTVPRMPPFPTGGPHQHHHHHPHSDPYMRAHPSQMPAMIASAPQFGSGRPMMYTPQQHMGMPPPLSVHQTSSSALLHTRVGSDAGEDGSGSIERSLAPPGLPGAKPGQNQGTPFISKLMHLLSNDRYSAYIRWNSAGDAFILSHTNQYFASQVLPLYFRHSNTSSFIRQLNLYQFQRLPIMQLLETLDDGTSGALAGATAPSSCFSGFSHPLFKRDQEELSYMIKPKPGKVRDRSAAAVAARKAKQSEGLSPSGEVQRATPPQSYHIPSRRATDVYKSEPARRGLRSSKRLEMGSNDDLSDHQEHDLQSQQQMMYPSSYTSGLSARP